MPSALTWIDFDSEAQQRAHRILTLFKERDTRDELGLGSIRDAISDTLFPGTSTIHTRLRYMLFVPWIYIDLERRGISSSKIREYSRWEQLRLAKLLKANSPADLGVIGGDVGDKLKTLPSAIYWSGLNRWGLRVYPGTEGQYHRALDEIYRRRKRAHTGAATALEHGDDVGGLWEIGAHTFHPGFPALPDNFPEKETFQLAPDEARYLQERLKHSIGDSLLCDLMASPVEVESAAPWTHPDRTDFRPEHRELLWHGRHFSSSAYGAAILYNQLLAELRGDEDLRTQHELAGRDWLEGLTGQIHEVADWARDLQPFWSAVHDRGHKIGDRTIAFVEQWVDMVLRFRGTLFDQPAARALIRNREIEKKHRNSRFTNSRVLDQWGWQLWNDPDGLSLAHRQVVCRGHGPRTWGRPMMLSPNNRSLYTEALTPPGGYVLDRAIATTFSMDLNTLLSVPLQLVLQSTEDRDELMKDPITLYEALQRATKRVHVFTHQGRIQAPRQHHLLYSLLEPMIVEVTAPGGGAFHPKLWILRFVDEPGSGVIYRLMLPSKNLTADRSWDVALTLDGVPERGRGANGGPLAEFIARLPEMSVQGFIPSAEFTSIARELRSVEWELPDGFDELRFHVLGLGAGLWRPRRNTRLAVISPFIRPKALQVLADTSDTPLALVSRAESLAENKGAGPFRMAYVLHDAAETEDGEDASASDKEVGLHAKIYVYQIEQRTHIALGSANATDAALVAGSNVEILAELAGPTHKVGAVNRLFNPDADDGLGQYLVPWSADGGHEVDQTKEAARRQLENLRDALQRANLTLTCTEQDDRWQMDLAAKSLNATAEDCKISAWPVTVGRERAVDLNPLLKGEAVRLPAQSLSSLTSLIAFGLKAGDEEIAFTLNLPVQGMPEERERAILRGVVNNREGFLRYLLLLLAGLGDGADVGSVARAFSASNSQQNSAIFDDLPLLEELVRAFSREPKRLIKVQRLIDDIASDGEADDLLPPGFMHLWQVFRQAMAHHER